MAHGRRSHSLPPASPVGMSSINLRVLASLGVLHDNEKAIEFCRDMGLLARTQACPSCGEEMNERTRPYGKDSIGWQCSTKTCRKLLSIRNGSFFEGSHLQLNQLLLLIYFWASLDITQDIVMLECDITNEVLVHWYNFLGEICTEELMQNPIVIGGHDHTVAIDMKVWGKQRKSADGQKQLLNEHWIFRGIDIETKEYFVCAISDQTRDVLHSLVKRHIAPGTRIWSNQSNFNGNLTDMPRGYLHETMDESGTDTVKYDMQRIWCEMHMKVSKIRGTRAEFCPSYLDEWLWRRMRDPSQCFKDIILAIATNPKYEV